MCDTLFLYFRRNVSDPPVFLHVGVTEVGSVCTSFGILRPGTYPVVYSPLKFRLYLSF